MSKGKLELTRKRPREEEALEAINLPPLPYNMVEYIGEILEDKGEVESGYGFFWRKEARTRRINRKLLQFARDGNFDQVFKFLDIRPDLVKEVLFALAGSAQQDKMQVILLQHPELLIELGPLTDISGAHFESITVFQHAVWAGDVRYMANMMLDCIPQNEAGEQIRLKLVEQYKDQMVNGVCYQLNGKVIRETQFSLVPLIKALAIYIKEFDNWDKVARENHWCKEVGGAQTLLPAHVRHHYISYDDANAFNKAELDRGLLFYNFVTDADELWCSSLIGLGLNFAMAWILGAGTKSGALADLTSIKNLSKIRTKKDWPALSERLERLEQVSEDNSELNSSHYM